MFVSDVNVRHSITISGAHVFIDGKEGIYLHDEHSISRWLDWIQRGKHHLELISHLQGFKGSLPCEWH